jgi:hypothetical protein
MSNTIIDANVAIKWVLKEPDSSLAEALLVELNHKGIVMYAPALLTMKSQIFFISMSVKGQLLWKRLRKHSRMY